MSTGRSARSTSSCSFARWPAPDGSGPRTGSRPARTDHRIHRSRRRVPPPARPVIAARSGAEPPPGAASARSGVVAVPSAAMRPVITFLTDFGPSAPGRLPRRDVRDLPGREHHRHQPPGARATRSARGAGSLVFALPHMPVGTHVAVVDPGVGTERLPVALKVARGDVLIGPDNGLLIGRGRGARRDRRGAGAREPRRSCSRVISSSFHGRDIFAPMAAHLAAGVELYEQVGPTVAIDEPRPAAGHPADHRGRRPADPRSSTSSSTAT